MEHPVYLMPFPSVGTARACRCCLLPTLLPLLLPTHCCPQHLHTHTIALLKQSRRVAACSLPSGAICTQSGHGGVAQRPAPPCTAVHRIWVCGLVGFSLGGFHSQLLHSLYSRHRGLHSPGTGPPSLLGRDSRPLCSLVSCLHLAWLLAPPSSSSSGLAHCQTALLLQMCLLCIFHPSH